MDKIIEPTNMFVIGSTEPLEISMICEKALSLKSQNKNILIVDCISETNKPLNFYFAEKYNLYKLKHFKKILIRNGISVIKLPSNARRIHNDVSKLKILAEKAAQMELIAIKRDVKPCEICHAKQKNLLVESYLNTYIEFENLLDKIKVECIYVYNGRFLIGNACWAVSKVKNHEIKFLEQIVMNRPDKYWVFEEPVHSTSYRAKVIHSFIGEKFDNNSEYYTSSGEEWYLRRINGTGQSFTSKQNLDFKKKTPRQTIVSYFTSSEDELILLGLEDPEWGDQKSIIVKMAEYFADLGQVNFVIRIHPNTNHKSSAEILRWKNFKKYLENRYDFIEVIDSLSKVNTYSLIKQSNLIVTAGSTVNLEAAFLKIPNVLIGNGLYKDMDIAFTPKNYEEFSADFNNYLKNNKSIDFYQNAIKTAAFHNNAGIPFNFVAINPQGNEIRIFKTPVNNSKIYSLSLKFDKIFLKFKTNSRHALWHNRYVEKNF
jgi:hypothetical protein